jgi:hypothetical protein
MTKKNKRIPILVFSFLILSSQLLFSQQTVDSWKITPGTDGKSATMVFSNPATNLNIESDLDITVDGTGAATSGAIKFKTGLQRQMTPGEVVFYFTEYKGDNAYWNFRQGQGSVVSFTSSTDAIPVGFIGSQVRVFSKDGVIYIGTLSSLPTSPDWFALNVKSSRILFYRNAVKEIQQLK